MKKNIIKLFKMSILMGILGLIMLLIVVFSGISHPNPTFKILVFTGILLVFLCVGLAFVCWILMMKDAITSKKYRRAIGLFLIGVIIILLEVVKVIFK